AGGWSRIWRRGAASWRACRWTGRTPSPPGPTRAGWDGRSPTTGSAWGAPASSAIAAGRRAGVPVATTYHGVYNARSALKRWYNGVMTRGDLTIANSDFTRGHVLAEHRVVPERVVAIPRGVDLRLFDPASVSAERIDVLRRAWGVKADE